MTDDGIALLGCAIALLVASGFLAVSLPLGRLVRSRAHARTEQRTVAFRVPQAQTESATDRRAA